VPPCGCSVTLRSLSCFSLPCFRSWQPPLSAFAASLRSFVPHSLRSAATHPTAAVFGSPAGRCGLRLTLFDCLRFALAIKAVASCSALRAVTVFAGKPRGKNPASPPLLHVPSIAVRTSRLPVRHPCSTRSQAR